MPPASTLQGGNFSRTFASLGSAAPLELEPCRIASLTSGCRLAGSRRNQKGARPRGVTARRQSELAGVAYGLGPRLAKRRRESLAPGRGTQPVTAVAALIGMLAFVVEPALALDCRKARAPAEVTICPNPEVRNCDQAMSKVYEELRRSLPFEEFKGWSAGWSLPGG